MEWDQQRGYAGLVVGEPKLEQLAAIGNGSVTSLADHLDRDSRLVVQLGQVALSQHGCGHGPRAMLRVERRFVCGPRVGASGRSPWKAWRPGACLVSGLRHR